jgi:type IV pilus assembly protein PilN
MYGLDINFLSDREIRPVAETSTATAGGTPGDRRPLYLGLIAGVAALALVGGYWLVLQRQMQQLRAQDQQLDADIAAIQGQLQEINTLRAQIQLVRDENAAFANVFNQIRPWSALLQEVRDRVPERVRVVTIQQTGGTPIPPETTPPQSGGVEVVGAACSFDDINDFSLVLQQSPLLDGGTVVISQSARQEEFLDPDTDGTCPGTPAGTVTALVDFTIRANLTDIPATELLTTLDRQGAVGLATRIRALRDSGVIETP